MDIEDKKESLLIRGTSVDLKDNNINTGTTNTYNFIVNINFGKKTNIEEMKELVRTQLECASQSFLSVFKSLNKDQ